jgi:putative FmdB family regulatory protein
MPLYDFACEECGQPFEALVRSDSEAATLECPHCAGKKVQKQLSLPARPVQSTTAAALPSACGEGPPCGAPWCQRK